MKDKKLPEESACLEYAEHVAEDLKPKGGDWKSEEIETYWFKPHQLQKLIQFAQGKPIQDDLFKTI